MNIRLQVKQVLTTWLEANVPDQASVAYVLLVLCWIGLVYLAVHLFIHRFVRWLLQRKKLARFDKLQKGLFEHHFFRRAALIIQGWIVLMQATFWLDENVALLKIATTGCELWMLVFGLLAFFSILDTLHDELHKRPSMARFPLKGLFQTVKLIALVMVSIAFVSVLIGKSPLLLLSGLGALSAVLLLVFKDPILGLVSGIQLSANNMLALGDWLEMPKYNADGDVIDISLTTVKVQNWDKTITTIPTYALISESFKNWRGMSESGGRRIKREIFIDTKTISFLNEEQVEKLGEAKLLTQYLHEKKQGIKQTNQETHANLRSLANGRRLTNVGTFRAYLVEYMKRHPCIHQEMTLLVRQLGHTAQGLPIQIYAFTNTTNWNAYEGIQSDIFDHIFAVLPEFGLRVHESPTGSDIQLLRT